MRGKETVSFGHVLASRITPAYAGKSLLFRTECRIGRDHPRVCGEKGQRQAGKHSKIGITPAYAGKSVILLSTMYSSGDHPRVCGEKRFQRLAKNQRRGSPPRMRGKATLFTLTCHGFRITPAYAGKSVDVYAKMIANEDHPRVCGEKLACSISQEGCRGSPPRVRGKVKSYLNIAGATRITPACAGKSCIRPVLKPCLGGSPPRVRGKVAVQSSVEDQFRITPACAGKRGSCHSPCGLTGDHPRVCGEKTKKIP